MMLSRTIPLQKDEILYTSLSSLALLSIHSKSHESSAAHAAKVHGKTAMEDRLEAASLDWPRFFPVTVRGPRPKLFVVGKKNKAKKVYVANVIDIRVRKSRYL